MSLPLARYEEQARLWPRHGRHILAHFDAETITVYQAYRPSIGHAAAADGRFGGPSDSDGFRFQRMSWIKPNFLWMMYRSGWGQKPDQEVTLAIRLWREAFDAYLARAVPSSFVPALYPEPSDWQRAVKRSDVRLQWDPDHNPSGNPVNRRAIQLGLRGDALAGFAGPSIAGIDDISDLVACQRAYASRETRSELRTPVERIYPVLDPDVRRRLHLDDPPDPQ